MRWLDIEWYRYLFAPRSTYSPTSWLSVLWCRIRNHPCGPVWYNPNGLEPDMHCKNCGDLI